MKKYSYQETDLVQKLPIRREDSHKGDYGKLLLVAGSKNMAGAAYLSAKAAYRAGTGLVYIYTPECNRVVLQQLIPEAVLITYDELQWDEEGFLKAVQDKDALAIGPGLGKSYIAKRILQELLKTELPKILDADALNMIGENPCMLKEISPEFIITPHLGEMSRLTGLSAEEIHDNKEQTAEKYACENHGIVVLKGHHTLVTNGREMYENQSGNNGMATAGSGDVLTGIIAGFLAQGLDAFEAAKTGVFVHGLAGDRAKKERGSYSMMASDIIDYILYKVSEKQER